MVWENHQYSGVLLAIQAKVGIIVSHIIENILTFILAHSVLEFLKHWPFFGDRRYL